MRHKKFRQHCDAREQNCWWQQNCRLCCHFNVCCMHVGEKLETVNGFGMNKLRLRKKCYIALNYFANFWWMEKNNIDKAITILQKAEFWPSKKEALQFGANCNSILVLHRAWKNRASSGLEHARKRKFEYWAGSSMLENQNSSSSMLEH